MGVPGTSSDTVTSSAIVHGGCRFGAGKRRSSRVESRSERRTICEIRIPILVFLAFHVLQRDGHTSGTYNRLTLVLAGLLSGIETKSVAKRA
jgi:hypothetical protein